MFSSYEITEWLAYENAYGPIGDHYLNETLAQMHELMQTMAYLAGAKMEENPVNKPTTHARPGAGYGFERDQYGRYTIVPEEVQEIVEEEESSGGFEALDAYFTSLEGEK